MSEHVVVAGGGPVGLAFAKDLSADRRLTITVVEKSASRPTFPTGQLDHRVLALTPGTQHYLARIGAWQHLPAARIQPVRAMRVFGDRAHNHVHNHVDNHVHSQLDFDARQPLAYIVEHQALIAALWQALEGVENVISRIGQEPVSCSASGQRRTLVTRSGLELNADLLVGADGPHSWIRQQAGIASRVKDYESFGVVANFDCEVAHAGAAYQWFKGDSILAYLPLPGRCISMVWSTTQHEGERLCQLTPEELSLQVAAAGSHVLGRLSASSPAVKFPLRRAIAETWVQPGLALIGDAAHSVHPLAGQGANLGFADACALAKTLSERGRLSLPGDYAVLRRYERSRQEQVWAMATMGHELRRLFQHPSAAVGWARNQGLKMLNRQSVVKKMMMEYARA